MPMPAPITQPPLPKTFSPEAYQAAKVVMKRFDSNRDGVLETGEMTLAGNPFRADLFTRMNQAYPGSKGIGVVDVAIQVTHHAPADLAALKKLAEHGRPAKSYIQLCAGIAATIAGLACSADLAAGALSWGLCGLACALFCGAAYLFHRSTATKNAQELLDDAGLKKYFAYAC